MINSQNNLVLKLNRFIFPFLIVFTYLFILLETYLYMGVLKKYILVDSRFFVILCIVSAPFLKGKKYNLLISIVYKINSLVLILLTITYLCMQFMEAGNYHNFVFSKYHIQPNNLLYLIILCGGLFLLNDKNIGERYINKSLLTKILLIIVMIIFVGNAVGVVNDATYSNFYALRHLSMTHDDKMRERWGFYYDYMKFVKENTPKDSAILVPPQKLPWYSTGNVGLDRYFLYPRNLGNGARNTLLDVDKYDYVLIVWGEWNDAPPDSYGWPKSSVLAEEIIYINPSTLKITRVEGNYEPEESAKVGVWGLIKVKK